MSASQRSRRGKGPKYPLLFKPGKIGTLSISNRIIMPAIATSYASDSGGVTDWMIRYYNERAKGGAGLIIVESTAVESRGKAGVTQLRIDEDRYIPGLNRLAEVIKLYGTAAALQLNHGGGKTLRSYAEGHEPVAPSSILYGRAQQVPAELDQEQIEIIAERFAEAAERARMAGFDAVEIHGAHGYLIAQFMSPYTNRREDAFGRDVEGRMRFPLMVLERIRQRAGRDYPLIFRLSADEFIPGGRGLEESLKIAPMLEAAGVDALDISAGASGVDAEDRSILTHVEPMSYPQAWRVYLAEAVKSVVQIPIITVGVIREPEVAERILEQGKADFVAVGRGLIADPSWPQKARSGQAQQINKCISCNEGCLAPRVFRRVSVRCTVNPQAGREGEMSDLTPADPRKRVVVVGGGPAGMEAAATAAGRGHEVTLLEREADLGGMMKLAAVPPHKEKILWFLDYQIRRLGSTGVEVRCGVQATRNILLNHSPDAVILATGGIPFRPNIPGIDQPHSILATELLATAKKMRNRRILVAGGGSNGCEVALLLAQWGNRVTLVSSRETPDELARDMDPVSRLDLITKLQEIGVKFHMRTRIVRISSDSVVCNVSLEAEEISDQSDLNVFAFGLRSNDSMEGECRHDFSETWRIGDARSPGRIIHAVNDGFRVGRLI